MKPTISKIALATCLLLLVASLAEAQDWKGRGRLSGRVTTEDGKPIEGAKISLYRPGEPEDGPEPFYTNENGRWSYLGLDGGAWTILIEAEGYTASEGSLSVNEFGRNKPVVVELRPNPFAFVDKGEALMAEGDYEAARTEFQRAIAELGPEQQAQLHAIIGDTYYKEERYDLARAEYQKAIPGLKPEEQIHVRLRLGDSFLQQQQFTAAREQYLASLPELGPEGQIQVLTAVARTYDRENNRAKAIETVEQVLEIEPNNVQALQLIADLLSREGRDADAQAYIERIPADTELPPDMLLNMGIRHYNNQKPDEALEAFDRVIRQDESLADAYYYRGLVYLSQGKNDEAAADFHKLIDLAPDSQQATEAKEFLTYLEQQ